MQRIILIMCAMLISSMAYANHFQKNAILLLAKHFALTQDASSLKEPIDQDALNYLNFAIQIYQKGDSTVFTSIPSSVSEYASIMESREPLGFITSGASLFSIRSGRDSVEFDGNGNVSINGRKQKSEIASLPELEDALANQHWYTVRTCIEKIAAAAQKALLNSKEKENVDHAKHFATSPFVPTDLRTQLLTAFAEVDTFEYEDWLLRQNDFKGHAKEQYILKLVDQRLAKERPEDAEKLIKTYLTPMSSAQETASAKVFYYYFNLGNIDHAEEVLSRHFKKDLLAYEKLGKVLFDYYLNLDQLGSAESVIRKHFSKGFSESDRLVNALVEKLLQTHEYEEARRIADRNMSQGYSDHDKITKHILEEEVAYLRKLKK